MNVVRPNQGYEKMFAPNQLTLGVFFAIESYSGSIPTMENQITLAKRAEALSFAALWNKTCCLRARRGRSGNSAFLLNAKYLRKIFW